MESRKFPHVVHVVHSLEGGGTELMLLKLVQSFERRLMRHSLVTLRDAGELAARLPDHVACHAMETPGRDRLTGVRLARILARLKPDVIHARNVCTWADTTMARILFPSGRLVLGYHGLQAGGAFTRRDWLVAKAAQWLGAEFTSVSQAGRRKIIDELGVPQKRISVLNNGVALGEFQTNARKSSRDSLGLSPDDFVIGTVGSLTNVKGHEVLLTALAAVRFDKSPPRLLIVGDGPLRGYLEQRAAHLGLADRVHFIGFRTDIAELLAAMDLYVCASLSEGMSNALMEAMAAGLPLISTNVGDHAALIRDGVDGFLVPPGEARSLATAIIRMAASSSVREEMGRHARQRITDFSFSDSIAAYQSFYLSLLPNRRTSRSQAFVAQCQKVSPAMPHLAPSLPHH